MPDDASLDPTGIDLAGWRALAARLAPPTRLFIDGDWQDAADGARFQTVNPATGTVLAEVARAQAADVDTAVAAAKRAFRSGPWPRLAPRERMAVLYRFAELIDRHAAELALLDTLDMGKPITDMVTVDIPETVKTFRFFAECIDKVDGKVTSTEADVLHYVLRQPLGVVGAISPWNYPLLMATWKIAPALAAGNTVVLKPAEQAPLSCLRLAELFMQAGAPAGVLNVLAGFGEEAGQALARHMDVAKIAFTGSGAVGRKILIYSGESNMKRVALECGGKSPQLFLGDLPDMTRAVTAAVNGIYANQGEVCNAGSRLLIDRSIYGDFLDAFANLTPQSYAPGDPLDPATTLGPLVTHDDQRRVLGMVETGRRDGARLVFGGDAPAALADGAYVSPTLFADVAPGMTIAREEIFGPVAAAIPVDGPDEAVAVANDTVYGLAAGVWTRDLGTAHRLIRDIEAGVVWVNCFDEGDMTQPFGGWKESGTGRDKCFESLLEYTQLKSAWIRLE